jgi:hypothetical protein
MLRDHFCNQLFAFGNGLLTSSHLDRIVEYFIVLQQLFAPYLLYLFISSLINYQFNFLQL